MKTRGFKVRKTLMAELFFGLVLFGFAQYIQPAKACDDDKAVVRELKRGNDMEERRIREERFDSRSLRTKERK